MRQFIEHHTFTGMQKDISPALHQANFLYDARNIRLTTRGDSTELAITNEKGTTETGVSITGTYLGHCLLNQYLVVFSTYGTDASKKDYITRIDLSFPENAVKILYEGSLRFSTKYPIETLASYENEKVQKVYWTDNLNQPRLVNIVGEFPNKDADTQFDFIRELQLKESVSVKKEFSGSGRFAPGVIQYAFTYYSRYGQESNIFYTTPLYYISPRDRGGNPEEMVNNSFKIIISNPDYNFDFLRVYSIQRTSLNDVSICKRVADILLSPGTNIIDTKASYESNIDPLTVVDGVEDLAANIFGNNRWYGEIGGNTGNWYYIPYTGNENIRLKVSNNSKIDYITWDSHAGEGSCILISSGTNGQGNYLIYSNSTTPVADQPLPVSSALDLSILEEGDITLIDTGNIGNSIDPQELLFKGGKSIIAGTIEQKDNTLFLGDIELKGITLNYIPNVTIGEVKRNIFPTEITKTDNGYEYYNQLTSYNNQNKDTLVPCGGFKRGNTYRLGVQLQAKDGSWSEVRYIADKDVKSYPTIVRGNNYYIELPCFKGTLNNSDFLKSDGWQRIRGVVVYPGIQDRKVICQGVPCPAIHKVKEELANNNHRVQSSWFFRPFQLNAAAQRDNILFVPQNKDIFEYADDSYSPGNPNIKKVEIQGNFTKSGTEGTNDEKFKVSSDFFSLSSPEFDFEEALANLDFNNTSLQKVGTVNFGYTAASMNIQTESSAIGPDANKERQFSYTGINGSGIISGLFFEDYLVDTNGSGSDMKYRPLSSEKSPVRWMIYPWQRSGSLNNDVNRASDSGTQSAVLKKKIISNLRYTTTSYIPIGEIEEITGIDDKQLFNSDQLDIIKLNDNVYQGNVNTVLSPVKDASFFFAFKNIEPFSTDNPFVDPSGAVGVDADVKYSTFGRSNNNISYYGSMWRSLDIDLAQGNNSLLRHKGLVRMKYKSSPHLVFKGDLSNLINSNGSTTPSSPLFEVMQDPVNPFGGTSEDALKANIWIPCGEPVTIKDSGTTEFYWSYGDTYFQRWDCLKTYPFTNEDENQIVEIGSFMLESYVNLDGRYDRNRGQLDNTNMSPRNFNLLNPVYSQTNNFFTYRTYDIEAHKITRYSNQVTWGLEKQPGADVDVWTNITLASILDLDGSKGSITAIRNFNDTLLCFQSKGISQLLFNSRVQIPTSDGVPIEITNSYKMEGYRYLAEGIGCNSRNLIKKAPTGIYFLDSISKQFYHYGDGLKPVSIISYMSSWFDVNGDLCKKILYDDYHKDVYLIENNQALCYSEKLSQFVSFMDYGGINLIESYNGDVFTLKSGDLYKMFSGKYNEFFGEPKPWYFSFISNGLSNQHQDFTKIFSTIDYRMDKSAEGSYQHNNSLDHIRVTNEYQDTGNVELNKFSTPIIPNKNLQKKFRTWRIRIPRDKGKLGGDRINNQWCTITLSSETEDFMKAILQDLNVEYYI